MQGKQPVAKTIRPMMLGKTHTRSHLRGTVCEGINVDSRASRTDVCACTIPRASERGRRDPQYLASPSSTRAPTLPPNPGKSGPQ